MSVETIELPKGLRDTLDAFILRDPTREHGGFIFGTPIRFDTFLPVPNVASNVRSTFKAPDNWADYATEFTRVVGSEVIAHVHTHPSHSIPSEQDFKAGAYWYRHVRYMILIAPDAQHGRTTWWVLDKNAEVQNLVVVDGELEAASLLVARRYGFLSLGHVLMDHDGKLRAPGAMPDVLLTNEDARRLYVRLREHGKATTQKELAEVAGLSVARTNTAVKALDAAGLLVPKGPYQSYRTYRVVDLFGRGG